MYQKVLNLDLDLEFNTEVESLTNSSLFPAKNLIWVMFCHHERMNEAS